MVTHADGSLVRSHGDVHRDPKGVLDALLIGQPASVRHFPDLPPQAMPAGRVSIAITVLTFPPTMNVHPATT
jgi:hypothetical protein